MRIFLQVVLPFLLPFVAFAVHRLLVTRGRRFLENAPWYRLTVLGLALACISLAALAFVGGVKPGGVYVPSRIEGGRIVPGTVERR